MQKVQEQKTEAARDIIRCNKHMTINSNSRLYKTCVSPTMTNDIKTKADTSATKRLIRTIEMRTQRNIADRNYEIEYDAKYKML